MSILPQYLYVKILKYLFMWLNPSIARYKLVKVVSLVSKEWRYNILLKCHRKRMRIHDEITFKKFMEEQLKNRSQIDLSYRLSDVNIKDSFYHNDEYKKFQKFISFLQIHVPLNKIQLIEPFHQLAFVSVSLHPKNDYQDAKRLFTKEVLDTIGILILGQKNISEEEKEFDCQLISEIFIDSFSITDLVLQYITDRIINLVSGIVNGFKQIKALSINGITFSTSDTLSELIINLNPSTKSLDFSSLFIENSDYSSIFKSVGYSKTLTEFSFGTISSETCKVDDIIELLNSNQILKDLTIYSPVNIEPTTTTRKILNSTLTRINIDCPILDYWDGVSMLNRMESCSMHTTINSSLFTQIHPMLSILTLNLNKVSITQDLFNIIHSLVKSNPINLKYLSISKAPIEIDSGNISCNQLLNESMLSNSNIIHLVLNFGTISCENLCKFITANKSVKVLTISDLSNLNIKDLSLALLSNSTLERIQLNFDLDEREGIDEYLQCLTDIINNENSSLTYIEIESPPDYPDDRPSVEVLDAFKRAIKKNRKLLTLYIIDTKENWNFIGDEMIKFC